MWDNLISLSFREKKKRQIVKYLLFGSQTTNTLVQQLLKVYLAILMFRVKNIPVKLKSTLNSTCNNFNSVSNLSKIVRCNKFPVLKNSRLDINVFRINNNLVKLLSNTSTLNRGCNNFDSVSNLSKIVR
jgi:hypothetical protein